MQRHCLLSVREAFGTAMTGGCVRRHVNTTGIPEQQRCVLPSTLDALVYHVIDWPTRVTVCVLTNKKHVGVHCTDSLSTGLEYRAG
jgi:hypothetical protein